MRQFSIVFKAILCIFVQFLLAGAEDPYKYYTWVVTYGNIYPLGTVQQGILINGQFPGPRIDCVTNDNLIINVINQLDEPFLLTWNGIKQRKNSWQDGVLGTNCPIPPNSNFTYKFQPKDQIGSFTYFPTVGMHRVSGGFGALNVNSRPGIPVPYPKPDGEFSLLIGDWYKAGHKALRQLLDSGNSMPFPDGLIINGAQSNTFTGDQGKTYLFRISNIGLETSINFQIQGHKLILVEVEGAHTVQNTYESLDLHVGQSLSVLVTLNQNVGDYYVIATTRFSDKQLVSTGVLHYSGSGLPVNGVVPVSTAGAVDWSMDQAKSFRLNLTANAARPNPQGSFHYGSIPKTRSVILSSSSPLINLKQRYTVNSISFVPPETPLKLADNYNIANVIGWDTMPLAPPNGGAPPVMGTPVVRLGLHEFVEIVFVNTEARVMSWHLDGYDFWVVGYGSGAWTENERSNYNLIDATTRHTVQVYPNGWSAILVSLDNQGMWNIRSSMWARQYLGQQFYIRVWTQQQSLANEYTIPSNALLCGKAIGINH